jgi:hypothetical protein
LVPQVIVNYDLQAPIRGKREKVYTERRRMHRRSHYALHLQEGRTTNKPKRPRNTPPTNQRIAHGFKAPQTRPNGHAKAQIIEDQLHGPPISCPEEGRPGGEPSEFG